MQLPPQTKNTFGAIVLSKSLMKNAESKNTSNPSHKFSLNTLKNNKALPNVLN
ncbi:hypothetical protein [Raineya sp.]